MSDETKKKCFVIAPIGDDGSEIRNHSDTVLECLINPVIESLGFEPGKRADHLGEPGIITRQIIKRIAEDELVIADLSGHNPNVFYELAIRHASGRPFIQMIRKGDKIPFDVGQQRTIPFDTKDLRDAEKAKAELRKQVEACMRPGFTMETPLGYAFDVATLQKGNPIERTLSVVLERLDYLVGRDLTRMNNALQRALYGSPVTHEAAALLGQDASKGRDFFQAGLRGETLDLFESAIEHARDVERTRDWERKRGGHFADPPQGTHPEQKPEVP